MWHPTPEIFHLPTGPKITHLDVTDQSVKGQKAQAGMGSWQLEESDG
jgi:hypothetical protein